MAEDVTRIDDSGGAAIGVGEISLSVRTATREVRCSAGGAVEADLGESLAETEFVHPAHPAAHHRLAGHPRAPGLIPSIAPPTVAGAAIAVPGLVPRGESVIALPARCWGDAWADGR